MVYAYPENVTGFVTLIRYINTSLMNNLLGAYTLVLIWFLVFFTMKSKGNDNPPSMLLSCFFCLFSAIFFRVWGILSDRILIGVVLITIFVGLYSYFKRGAEQ